MQKYIYSLALLTCLQPLTAATRQSPDRLDQDEEKSTLTTIIDVVCDAAPYALSVGALYYCYSLQQRMGKLEALHNDLKSKHATLEEGLKNARNQQPHNPLPANGNVRNQSASNGNAASAPVAQSSAHTAGSSVAAAFGAAPAPRAEAVNVDGNNSAAAAPAGDRGETPSPDSDTVHVGGGSAHRPRSDSAVSQGSETGSDNFEHVNLNPNGNGAAGSAAAAAPAGSVGAAAPTPAPAPASGAAAQPDPARVVPESSKGIL